VFQLLLLLSILGGIYGAITLLPIVLPIHALSRSLRGRISLAALFVFTGISHFLMPEEMAQLLPAWIPLRMELITVTGVLEILGALGLLIPRLARLASIALILFLLGVLPANIYGALNHVAFGAHQHTRQISCFRASAASRWISILAALRGSSSCSASHSS